METATDHTARMSVSVGATLRRAPKEAIMNQFDPIKTLVTDTHIISSSAQGVLGGHYL